MSFSNVAATTNGALITITYLYSGSPGAQITAFADIPGVGEQQVGGPVANPNNVDLSASAVGDLFRQGQNYGLLLKDDGSPPAVSSTNYYVYAKKMDSNNIYLGTNSTSSPFMLVDLGSTNKSAILPPFESAKQQIYYIKTKNTGNSFNLSSYINGITYPILNDTLVLTNSNYDAFDSSVNGDYGPFVVNGQNYCYSFCNLNNGDWSLLSQYTNNLTIADAASTQFTGVPQIQLTKQTHIYNYQDVSACMINFGTLTGTTTHNLVVYRTANDPGNAFYIGFGNQNYVDEINPGANRTNYLNIFMNKYNIFCLTVYVNSSNNKIYIVHSSDNVDISGGSYPGSGETITSQLINSGASSVYNIPTPILNTNYGSIRIFKYSSKNSRFFSMRARQSGENSLFLQGRGFVDNFYTLSQTNLSVWILVTYNGSIPHAFILHQYPT